MHIK